MKKLLLIFLYFLFIIGLSQKTEAVEILRIYKNTDSEQNVLNQKCDDITEFDSNLQTLIKNMIATMENAKGVGLAAPQIGKPIRLFVAKTSQGIKEFINPVITEQSGEYLAQEGCLSIPQDISAM